jgi:hypothetical protein
LPPEFAERHADLFRDYKVPRGGNFNPDVPSGVSWVAQAEKLNDTVLEFNDEWQRRRLRSLQAVDEMVETLVQMLEDAGQLDNTHIFYTSDNGYHVSQHRLHPGKTTGLEEDIRVPLVWRGPGVAAGSVEYFPTSHSDLAPTIMEITGVSLDSKELDGQAILPGDDAQSRSEHLAVEYWGPSLAESVLASNGTPESLIYPETTYKGLRIEAEEYGFYYSVWCTNESELYDMKADPGQMTNLMMGSDNSTTVLGRPLSAVVDRLDALLMVLKTCKERTCTHPWEALHPQGRVGTLLDALACGYDGFYAQQPKVSFDECAEGYLPWLEGPMDWHTFEGRKRRAMHGGGDNSWSFWE